MLLKLSWQYLKDYRLSIFLIFVLQILQALMGLTLPTLNADIIDRGILYADVSYVWKIGTLMLGLTVMQGIALGVAIYVAAKLSMGLGYYLRKKIFSQVSQFSAAEVGQFGVGSLITRCSNDVQVIQSMLFMTLTLMLAAPLMGIGGIFMAVHQDAKLSALLLVSVPILIIAFAIIVYLTIPLYRRYQSLLDQVNLLMRQQLTGVRVIRAFNNQYREQNRFRQANENLYDVSIKSGFYLGIIMPFSSLVVGLSWVGVIWFGGMRIDSGGMQVGSLVAFINYLIQILMAVVLSAMVIFMLPRASVAAGRIKEVLDTNPLIKNIAQPQSLPSGRLNYRIENLSLRFGEAEESVLSDLSLTVFSGQTVALIGPTGCGKTLVVNLFSRLIEPSEGCIRIENQLGESRDLRNISLEQARQLVAYVPQKAHLFADTVAANVASKAAQKITTADLKKVQKALKIACAWEFIETREGGMHASVGMDGGGFSGGQKQRLTIARAIYRILEGKAQMLIIDDGLSALDASTEAQLRKNLTVAFPDLTILIVTQRVSTVISADHILVMSEGKIVGRGSHQQLMKGCELYREIAASQLESEALSRKEF